MIEDDVQRARVEMGLSFSLLCEALGNDPAFVQQLCGAAKPTRELADAVSVLWQRYHAYREAVLERVDSEGGTIGTIELVRALYADAFSFSKLVQRKPEAIKPAGQRPRPEGKRNLENYYAKADVVGLFAYNSGCLTDATDNRKVGPVARWFLAWLREQSVVAA